MNFEKQTFGGKTLGYKVFNAAGFEIGYIRKHNATGIWITRNKGGKEVAHADTYTDAKAQAASVLSPLS